MRQNTFSLNPMLCAVLGAALSYYGFAPVLKLPNPLALIAAAGFVLAAVFSLFNVLSSLDRRCYRFARLALFSVFFAGGFVLGLAALAAASRDAAVTTGQPQERITGITGTLLDDPRISASGRDIGTLALSQAADSGGVRTSAQGKVLVFFPQGSIPRLKEFGRGSVIFVDGSFAKALPGRSAMFHAKSTHIIKAPSDSDRMRTGIRLALTGIFSTSDWGGLALALLLGIRDNLDSDLALQYLNSGCSHILALSGMHLAIVSSIFAFLLRKPLGLKAAAAISAAFIVLYVYLVGAQPSLVRSCISYLIGTIVILCSMRVDAVQILGLSFLIQIMLDPASGGTVSFVLSYLALAGILLLGQNLGALMRGMMPAFIAEPLSVSLGAFIATMSVTAAFFGNLRFIGIIAGLIMVPLTTLFMIGAMIFLAAHFLMPPLNYPLGTALSILYTLLEKTAYYAGMPRPLPISDSPLFVILLSIAPFMMMYFCSALLKVRYSIEKFDKL